MSAFPSSIALPSFSGAGEASMAVPETGVLSGGSVFSKRASSMVFPSLPDRSTVASSKAGWGSYASVFSAGSTLSPAVLFATLTDVDGDDAATFARQSGHHAVADHLESLR